MELLQLKYFLDVAETEHVTRSAKRMHVAQPAITQAIHRLESELGVPLFTHKGRNIILTEYGRYFRDRLTPLAREFTRLPEDMHTMANLENSTIHLNVLAASSLVTDAIAEYVHNNDGVDFRMMQNVRDELYDVSVTTRLFYQKFDDTYHNEYVCTERIYMAVPVKGRFENEDSIRLQDVEGEGFISLQGTSQLRLICDAFCRRTGFAPHVVFESDNPSAVRNMIGAGMGIGFWPEFTWGAIDSDRVRLLEIKEPLCQRDLIVTCKNNKADSTEVMKFFEFLTQYFERRRSEVK
jgi:LysR family transcriptional activator of glutamate synthase operon